MGLTCSCDSDWYPEPGDWYLNGSFSDYKPLPFKIRKRCCSCKNLINVGDLSIEHKRVRVPKHDVEINIYGDDGEIPIASDWMCETCGDLFLSLTELGYCVNPRDDMHELIKDYAADHATSKGD